MINVQKVQRIVVAGALASGLLSTGVAASAQTTGPATTNVAGATSNATSVSMSTSDAGARRSAQLEQANEDARRIAFRHLGTSL